MHERVFTHIQHPKEDVIYPIERDEKNQNWFVSLPNGQTITAKDVFTLTTLTWEALR